MNVFVKTKDFSKSQIMELRDGFMTGNYNLLLQKYDAKIVDKYERFGVMYYVVERRKRSI